MLSPEYVEIMYPGYFFNTIENRLYSNRTGKLKPLSLQPAYSKSDIHLGVHYTLKINKKYKYLPLDELIYYVNKKLRGAK